MGQAASPAPRRLRCRLRLRRRRRPCRRASAQRSGAGRLPPGSAPRARTRAGARRPRATATTRGASCERMGLAPRTGASGAGSTAPSLLPHRPQLRPRLRRCRPAHACRCGTVDADCGSLYSSSRSQRCAFGYIRSQPRPGFCISGPCTHGRLRARCRSRRPALSRLNSYSRCGTGSSTAAWTRGARSRRAARRSRALATRSAAACR